MNRRGTASAWHARRPEEVLPGLEVSKATGLSSRDVQERLRESGPNALPEVKRSSVLAVFFRQFRSPLIYLLLFAALGAFLVGEPRDAVVIVVVVLINCVVGALQEGKAERSIAALRSLSRLKTHVLRDGKEQIVSARDLVPGDLLILGAGDAVAADARLIEAANLEVSEAALTGESMPVGKRPAAVSRETQLADRRCMIYSGTHVTSGRGIAVVVATGLNTEVGKIAELTEAAEEPDTPLETRIAQFGRYVIWAAGVLFLAIVGLGMARRIPFGEIFMIGVSQVVSMIPEGLPVAVTVALSVGVQRLAARRTLVRRLSAVETLGSTSVICSDKTGTLTRNEMTVKALYLPKRGELEVTGVGYAPEGEIQEAGKGIQLRETGDLEELLKAGLLCNDSRLERSKDGKWLPVGDPTELALVSLALKGGMEPRSLRESNPRTGEVPFDADVKMMATQHSQGADSVVFVKGAPEAVLELCSGDVTRVAAVAEGMASRALRILALAKVEGVQGQLSGLEAIRGRAEFLGLVGQLDPPRVEAREAVLKCREAGIRPVMVTGDHKATAWAIARELGLVEGASTAIDGAELDQMNDRELALRLNSVSVFARVHPAQKLRIVEAYQAGRAVVAMTGDGVNDAPALAKANVGVAMGISGTEVAKEAAKIVIADDHFATIVNAVEEGRLIYRNIKKLILYLFSTSVSEILVLLTALLLGYPPPLTAVQILWVNLVTDGVLTVTLIMEPGEGDEMRSAPIPLSEPLLTRALLRRVALMAPAIATSTLGYFIFRLKTGVPFEQARTEAFTVLAVSQWFNVLNCRSEHRSAFGLSILRNKWLVGGLIVGNVLHASVIYLEPMNRLFHTVTLPLKEVVMIGSTASLVLWVEEIRKALRRRKPAAGSGAIFRMD